MLLSGSTDGSDAPTDATGAIIDTNIIAQSESMAIESALLRTQFISFFQKKWATPNRSNPNECNGCKDSLIEGLKCIEINIPINAKKGHCNSDPLFGIC